WTWLARKQTDEVAKRIKALKLAGVGLVKETRRVYPKGPLAGTLLGFVGVDNQGLSGIEHNFDDLLRGPPRHLDIQVDAMGRELLRDFTQNPMSTVLADGARVVLTLDEAIQHEAEKHLARTVSGLSAAGGWVIVMEPKTGDVLAFATWPTYDPNHPERASSVVANPAVSGVFEPGSTMKVFTVAAAIESGKVTPASAFDCPPRMTIGKTTIGDHDPPPGVRRLTVRDIIKVSSNVGTAQIGMRMPDALHRTYLTKFGFGRSTGSGLGGESAGLLPRVPWRPINHATISYGQGVSVTALQLAAAECVLANGGMRVTPRLIRRIVAPDGRTIQEIPAAPAERVLSERTAKLMMPILSAVVEAGGTGIAARIPGYHVAGKTGTAQKVRNDGRGYSSDVISSFVGFAPVEQPRIVVLASLDSPTKAHYASQTAAPLFRDVAGAALRILGVEPDPDAFNVPEPHSRPQARATSASEAPQD
ncbi:MAG: penicillin-binding protein 2, partial [Candidatus Sericytochromatia bacterium]|nr:penicillin-binding protein 2 [Candidatus Tanganyikabacteria bacterium]